MHTTMLSILIAFLGLGAVATVSLVGKPRKPVTPGVAVASVIINALLIVGALVWLA